MTGWIIFLAVVLFLLTILFTRIKINGSYRDSAFSLKVGFWFLNFTVLPQKKAEKPKKPKKEKKKKEKKPDQKKKADAEEKKEKKMDLEMITSLLSSARSALKIFFGHLWFDHINVDLLIADEDPAECAIRYGKVSGIVSGVLALCRHFPHVKPNRVHVGFDFQQTESVYEAEGRVSIRVVFILGSALAFLGSYIKSQIKK